VEFVEADGLRIAYRRSGSGPPVFLIHGGVSDSRAWRVELDTLADEFTVVAWDAPGCGASSDPPESFRLPEYADALAALVDALGLEPVHLVGHSWGAGLALELYRRRPELVAAMVLAGAYAGWAGSLPREEVEARLQAALLAAEPSADLEPTSVPGLFSDAIPADRVEELARIMSDVRPVATRVMAYAFAEADLRDMLGEITVPVLILAGEADERSPLSVAHAIHASIAGSRLVVLPGLGHEMFFEDSVACDAAVRAFLHEAAR
jgi:pimeloyl-ACP methyl ester carboxylesterase